MERKSKKYKIQKIDYSPGGIGCLLIKLEAMKLNKNKQRTIRVTIHGKLKGSV